MPTVQGFVTFPLFKAAAGATCVDLARDGNHAATTSASSASVSIVMEYNMCIVYIYEQK